MYKEYSKENLGNEKFFKFFKEISDIPRKSSNEKKIADYLVEFAKYRKLKYYRDNLNNVIIWKKASKGYEDKPILGIQNHTDMICEKDEGIKHDFSKDKLKLYIDGDFVKAKGTTLGADNGVGVAYALAILDSDDIASPELECIFTVQEETTMDGSRLLDVSKVKSRRIISFDSFYEDIMVVNSSSCKEWSSFRRINWKSLNRNEYVSYRLEFNNFKGGHSGLDIADEKRGNPIKLAFNLLSVFDEVLLSNINGGSRLSIIPRDVFVEFCVKNEEEFKINKINEEIKKILAFFNCGEKIEIKKINKYEKVMDFDTSRDIIGFVNEFENGALAYDEENQVILSANMGVVEIIADKVIFRYSSRSNERKIGNEMFERINRLAKKYLNNKENIKEETMKLIEKLNLENSEAVGVMYLESVDNKLKINPVVWVKEINTLFYETACGSGTTATAIVKSYIEGNDVSVDILQPSGYVINATITGIKENKLRAVISGVVLADNVEHFC